MPEYFIPILVLSCLIFHFFFGRSRIRRLEKINLSPGEKHGAERLIRNNTMFTILATSICFLIATLYCFFPHTRSMLLLFQFNSSKILDYTGMFLLKIAFIANIVIYFQVSDKLNFEFKDLTYQKILKMELLILFTTLLLSAGVFIYLTGFLSALVFLSAIVLFYNRSRS